MYIYAVIAYDGRMTNVKQRLYARALHLVVTSRRRALTPDERAEAQLLARLLGGAR